MTKSRFFSHWLIVCFLWAILAGCSTDLAATSITPSSPTRILDATQTPIAVLPPEVTSSPRPTRTATTTPPPSQELTNAKKQMPGEVYLLLKSRISPESYALGRLPAACLVPLEGCPPVEIILDREEGQALGLGTARISIAPDRESIWFLHEGKKNIDVLDLRTGAVKTILFDVPLTKAEPVWSPYGRFLAIGVGDTSQLESSLVSIDRITSQQRVLLARFDQQIAPIGWLSTDEILYLCQEYNPGSLNADQLADPIRSSVHRLNISSGKDELLISDVLAGTTQYLSPDRRQLIFESRDDGGRQRVFRFDLRYQKIAEISGAITALGWSSDGKKLAVFGELQSERPDDTSGIYIVAPDGSPERLVIGYMGVPLCFNARWLMNTQFLIHTIPDAATRCSTPTYTLVNTASDLYDIQHEQDIYLDGKQNQKYDIVSIYW